MNRIKELKNILGKGESFVALDGATRYYLTGFMSSDGAVVVTRDGAWFLTDSRYIESAGKTVADCEVLLSRNLKTDIYGLIKNKAVKLYVEPERISHSDFCDFCENFKEISVSDDIKIENEILKMRSVKTARELKLIKAAQEMTDKTFSYITERIKPGMTEMEVMLDMEFYMRSLGSEGVSFDFIVVSGASSSLPHGVPTDKKIEKGDFVTMDFGAVCGGYRSDMTRTVAVGSVGEEQKKVYATVLEAQKRALSEISSGKVCRDIDKTARDYIAKNGYGEYFGHGLGHSVGIEIHEHPNFNTRCEEVLLPGTVMTVEPGIYLPGKFGVRIEDMVCVTENGCENLTHSPKELMIL